MAVGGSYISSHIILEYGQLIIITMYEDHLLRPKLISFWHFGQVVRTKTLKSCAGKWK